MAPGAGCAIIACGDSEKQSEEGFLISDCSAAMENMLLAAHGLGFGAVWCGIYPIPPLMQLIKETAKLPDNIIPVGMMVVGHKDQERRVSDRYDAAKVHNNQW
jgi:nitroreductase